MEKEDKFFFKESINNFQKLLFTNKNEKFQYFFNNCIYNPSFYKYLNINLSNSSKNEEINIITYNQLTNIKLFPKELDNSFSKQIKNKNFSLFNNNNNNNNKNIKNIFSIYNITNSNKNINTNNNNNNNDSFGINRNVNNICKYHNNFITFKPY
jgi:hypothetical protein